MNAPVVASNLSALNSETPYTFDFHNPEYLQHLLGENERCQKTIEDLQNEMALLRLDNENKDRQIDYLRQLLRESKANDNSSDGANKILKSFDLFEGAQTEIAELKNALFSERKKSTQMETDLRSLRDKMHILRAELQDTEKGQLILEKASLEENLQKLVIEVEFLSNRNEALLGDLRSKDYYECFDEMRKKFEKLTSQLEEYKKLSIMPSKPDVSKTYKRQPRSR